MRYMLNVYGFKFFANTAAEIQSQYDKQHQYIPAGTIAVLYKLEEAGTMKAIKRYTTTRANK